MAIPTDPVKAEIWRAKQRDAHLGQKWHGVPVSEESRKKMSESAIKRCTPEFREHMRIINLGRRITDEQKQKLSAAQRGHHKSETTRQRMREYALNRPEAHKKKIQIALSNLPPEFGNQISRRQTGENNPVWNGGSSFEPYCPKFTREFKERVRAFFGYICVECGTPQNGKKLGVHHVNFNKQMCCNSDTPLFVPLCNSCHSKTNGNRDYWQQHFTDMINMYYEGKCYFTQEEMGVL